MKKRNVATVMAAAMTLGTVAPSFAAVVTSGNVDVAKASDKEVSLKKYEEIYNTNFTKETEDDTLKAGYEILDIVKEDKEETDKTKFLYVVSKAYNTSEMSKEQLEDYKEEVSNAKTNLEDTEAYIDLLVSRGYKKDTKYTKSTTKATAGVVELVEGPSKTVTITDKDGNIFYKVKFTGIAFVNTAVKVDEKTITIPELDGKPETTKAIITAHKDISKLAYDLGKMTGIEVEKHEEGYDATLKAHRNLVLKVYKKAEKASERTLIGEYTINNFAEFDKSLFVNVESKNDYSKHWAEAEIFNAMYAGHIDNVGTFRPEDYISRAEFTKILVNYFGIDTKSVDKYKNPFSDVKEGTWEYKYILAAYVAGIAEGDGDGTFRPEDQISRQEAAKMVAAIAAKQGLKYGDPAVAIKGESFDSKGKHNTVSTNFKDDKDIAEWADESIKELNAAGVITGYDGNKFMPENNIKRAESIVMMDKAARNLK